MAGTLVRRSPNKWTLLLVYFPPHVVFLNRHTTNELIYINTSVFNRIEGSELKLKKQLAIIGIGPGNREGLTAEALEEIGNADVVVGYPLYLKLISDITIGKELISTPMRKEIERIRMAFEQALKGKRVVLVCSGDAGIYGLASPAYELSPEYPDVDLHVVSGVTAAASGAALLGAPLGNDFCTISLSDYLTPWEMIAKRLSAAAEADFVIVLYNAGSNKRPDALKNACAVLSERIEAKRCCGIAENIGREGETARILPFAELSVLQVGMTATVFIGNSQSKFVGCHLVTPRGYVI